MIKIILTNSTFLISDFKQTKEKVLNWAQQFDTFCFLDNHQYQVAPHTVECMLAAGVKRQLKADAGNALEKFQQFISEKRSWLFGHLAYDLKNEIENLSSGHPDPTRFPDLFFFEPEVMIRLTEQEIIIEADDPAAVFNAINQSVTLTKQDILKNDIKIQNRISRNKYVQIINKLKQHILRGDCYEINFCQEFFVENAAINPAILYKKLSTLSPNPFSALYRIKNNWLVCASPERFLKKQGNRIFSQPIKGTSKRNLSDSQEDENSKRGLKNSKKDRSENVMVVDLVRNDLAKICEKGTVRVDELYGIYSFPQVHQMISTVSGELKKEIPFTEIIRATFPMGSMTGAPKLRVMELIEKYESTKRGIFSGAVGYISPDDDFDFNVVIRSIMYNADSKYLSFLAGSGITFSSEPKKEWEECLMKADAMKSVLEEQAEPAD